MANDRFRLVRKKHSIGNLSQMSKKPITVITRDNIRTLRPHQEPAAQPVKKPTTTYMSISELQKIKDASFYLTNNQLVQQNEFINEQKDQLALAAKQRKTAMEKYDQKRAANQKLSELEQEAKVKSNYLLAKAQLQLEEQEDEIKHLNELMLYAKCVSIRDVQVQEKKLIQKEKKEEEARLDSLMEYDRVNELKKIEEREKERVEELRKGAAKIREQIRERQEAALLDQERRDQETKAILKAIADNIEAEKREKITKIQNQKNLMIEVARANQDSIQCKKLAKLAEEEEDRKVLQYLLDKEKREEEKDKLVQIKKAEREKELARLRLAQEKMSDKQAAQDALRAQRAYEAHEREWRRKEKEAAEKQASQEKELREERIKQQKAREYAIAVEAHSMRQEFYENLHRQKALESKLKLEESVVAEKNKKYAQEVQTQIREKEINRRKEREEFFLEGIRVAKQRTEQTTRIDSIKERKIQQLRGLGVPEKYVKEIERQVLTKPKHSLD